MCIDKLILACKKGDLENIKILLKEHDLRNFLIKTPFKQNDVLETLVDNNHYSILSYFFNNFDIPINSLNNNKKISKILHYALLTANLDAVKYLLSSEELNEHANIEKDYSILNTLFSSDDLKKQRLSILKYFIESGEFGKYLHMGNEIPEEKDLFHDEIDTGFHHNKNYIDFNYIFNKTDFLFKLVKNLNALKYIFEHPYTSQFINIDIEHSDIKINLAFMAARRKCIKACEYLISKTNINITAKNKFNQNILMNICDLDHTDVLIKLMKHSKIKNNIDLYEKDEYGYNIFMLASENNNLNLINYLLKEHLFEVDYETLSWLKGKNMKKKIYSDVIKIIETYELQSKLENSLTYNSITKKLKKI